MPDGATLYEHLKRLQSMSGITDPRLKSDPLPVCAGWVYDQFWRLSRRRGMTAHGAPLPLSFVEIETLERLNRIAFTQFDLHALEEMDAAYISATQTKQ
jgi:hypothetical protein